MKSLFGRLTASLGERLLHGGPQPGLVMATGRPALYRQIRARQCCSRRRGLPLSLLLLDLDGFRHVNDLLGYDGGDRLLERIGPLFEPALGNADSLVRLEGDKWALLLPNRSAAELSQLAAGLQMRLAQFRRYKGLELQLSACIGLYVDTQRQASPQRMLLLAERGLYQAKRQGRGHCVCYDTALDRQICQRIQLMDSLRGALAGGQLSLHYQPMLDAGTGRVVALEALLRWQHPERGAVSPMEFIPLAEESGLIIPIGEWVIRHACEQLKAWQQRGLAGLTMSVNVSARQFTDRQLLASVDRILLETGVAPGDLELEITESLAMESPQRTIETLSHLKALGVRCAIDDFGTGYSSLSYLKHLPANRLKVDRSFIRELAGEGHDAAIVGAVIQLAHSMALQVVAEGVETPEQHARLQALECDLVQGYLFARPLPAEQLWPRLQQRADGLYLLPAGAATPRQGPADTPLNAPQPEQKRRA